MEMKTKTIAPEVVADCVRQVREALNAVGEKYSDQVRLLTAYMYAQCQYMNRMIQVWYMYMYVVGERVASQ